VNLDVGTDIAGRITDHSTIMQSALVNQSPSGLRNSAGTPGGTGDDTGVGGSIWLYPRMTSSFDIELENFDWQSHRK
jgi:hypothetical protein